METKSDERYRHGCVYMATKTFAAPGDRAPPPEVVETTNQHDRHQKMYGKADE